MKVGTKRHRLAPLALCTFVSGGSIAAGQSGPLVCVADREADPDGLGGNTGAVFLYDDAVLVEAIGSLDFVDPIRVESDAAGNLYILDASADPLQQGMTTGAVLLRSADGQISVYAVSAITSNLTDLARAADGTLYMTGTAIVEPGPDFFATVFKVDTNGTISTFASGPEFSELTGVDLAPNGDLIVTDRSAGVGMGGEVGAIFRVTPTGAISVVATSLHFAELQGIAVSEDGGTFHVIDAAADPNSQGFIGAVFDVTSAGAVSVRATDPQFTNLDDIIRLGDDVLVLDTDTVVGGPGSAPGVVFRVSTGGTVSVEVSDGSSWSAARGVNLWTEPPGDTVGDLDGDGDVDVTDFAIFAQCFGGSLNPPAAGCPDGIDPDLDDDGDADTADFALLAQNFGN